MSPETTLTDGLRTLCEALVDKHMPAESPLFSAVWDAVWRVLPASTIEALRERVQWQDESAAIVDLGAVGDASQQVMDTLHVIAAMTGACVALLNCDSSEPLTTAVARRALHAETKRLNTPPTVRTILDSFAAAMLAEQLQSEGHSDESSQDSPRPADVLWIELLSPGTVGVQGAWSTVDETSSSVSPEDCDLTIDEPNATLWSWHNRKRIPRSFGKIGPSLKVLLWMMLTQVGHTFTFLQIIRLLGEQKTQELNESHRQRVYQYRNRLAKILGTGGPGRRVQRKRTARGNGQRGDRLIERVLSKDGPMTYFVRAADWSFCWIRREQDATCSLLVGHLDPTLLAPPKNQ